LRLGDYDETEPDIVLSDLTKYDGRRHPRPAETILVIEVAESSLRIDRNTKLPLYAANEIPEFWIVNIPDRIVEVYKNPDFGMYRTTEIFKLEDTVKSNAVPDFAMSVNDLLG
jgi:Uma2 family endonuclease